MGSPAGNMFVQVPEEINNTTALLQEKKHGTTTKHPSFCEYFSEYTSAASIDGLQYLGEQKRSKFERILWLVVIGVSLATCFVFILETYKKWETTPVIVTLASSPMSIWKIPFPAVTICSTERMRFYYHSYLKPTDANVTFSEDDRSLCQISDNSSLMTDDVLVHILEMASRSKEKVIISCAYASLEERTTLFSTVTTEEGVCYTFNALNRNDIFRPDVYHLTNFLNHNDSVINWSIESGYAKSAGKNAFPRRTMSAGAEGGLSLRLWCPEKQLLGTCRESEGFKVIVHHPAEIPRVRAQHFMVPYQGHVTVALKPDVMKTSESLRNYDPHKRGCYFANEKQLSYYKHYTQQNCQMEYLTNYTLKMCGCVSFYMPRRNTTNACEPRNTSCADKAKLDFLHGNAMSEFNGSRVDMDYDCLPPCTTLSYNIEISQTTLERMRVQYSNVNIFFREMQFITSERNELYGVVDFLANCGGLLGLFTGFSLISLVEILYFLTVRLGIKWRRY